MLSKLESSSGANCRSSLLGAGVRVEEGRSAVMAGMGRRVIFAFILLLAGRECEERSFCLFLLFSFL